MSSSALQPVPAHLSARYRLALLLGECAECSLPQPIPADCDSLLALLPRDCEPPPAPGFRADRREWLTPQRFTTEITPKKYGTGEVFFGGAPEGLSRVEGLLAREMGVSCARATAFLAHYYRGQRFAAAAAAAGVTFDWIGLCRNASPLFAMLYNAVCAAVKQGRAEIIEDAMFARATGQHRARETKEIAKPDGTTEVITTDSGEIYDTKAAALLLPAYRPESFAPRAAAGPAIAIQINVAVPPPPPATGRAAGKEAAGEPVVAQFPAPTPEDAVIV